MASVASTSRTTESTNTGTGRIAALATTTAAHPHPKPKSSPVGAPTTNPKPTPLPLHELLPPAAGASAAPPAVPPAGVPTCPPPQSPKPAPPPPAKAATAAPSTSTSSTTTTPSTTPVPKPRVLDVLSAINFTRGSAPAPEQRYRAFMDASYRALSGELPALLETPYASLEPPIEAAVVDESPTAATPNCCSRWLCCGGSRRSSTNPSTAADAALAAAESAPLGTYSRHEAATRRRAFDQAHKATLEAFLCRVMASLAGPPPATDSGRPPGLAAHVAHAVASFPTLHPASRFGWLLRQHRGSFVNAVKNLSLEDLRTARLQPLEHPWLNATNLASLEGAQQIVDGLFLSGIRRAEDPAWLREQGIQCVINCSEWHIHCSVPSVTLFWDHADLTAERLNTTADALRQAKTQGPVLVHCLEGVNRSATLVAAHLMKTRCLDAETAVRMVQQARPIAQPDAAALGALQELLARATHA